MHEVHRVINYLLMILFPIWWLVPSGFILGDIFVGIKVGHISVIFVALIYNIFYPFVLAGCCNRKKAIHGPTYSCETGCSIGFDTKELPPTTDVGFGLTFWMRPLFSLAIICSSRTIGWIFAPFWSSFAFLIGFGIEVGVSCVCLFLSCIWGWMFEG